jgi:alcohol dehydrogenase class IV
MDISFFVPTRVVMSQDCIQKNSGLIAGLGQRALIVTGAFSAKQNGSLQDVTDTLNSLGIAYDIYDKVMSNPTITCCYEGADFAKQVESDFVIGIGGGSPMDAAKAIALLAVQDIPEEELFLGNYEDKALPIIMVPTTAGTGSEVTPYSVLMNNRLQTKNSISTPALFPKMALLDAKYMKSLSMPITIHTALDALSHAIEGMLTVRASDMTNHLAVESMKKLSQGIKYLSPSKEMDSVNSLTLDVREKLLYGSMLAGMVIAHTGTTAVHSMGYALTYFKNVDHGRANALLLPSFLRFIARSDSDLVKRILTAMGQDSIDEFETLFLKLLGDREEITTMELEKYAGIAIQAKNISNSKIVPTKEDLINIYSRSLQII